MASAIKRSTQLLSIMTENTKRTKLNSYINLGVLILSTAIMAYLPYLSRENEEMALYMTRDPISVF